MGKHGKYVKHYRDEWEKWRYSKEFHTTKCELAGYKRIDIKELLKQKTGSRPSVYVMFDENFKDENNLDETVTNAQIQKILHKIDDMEYLQRAHGAQYDDNRIPDFHQPTEYSRSYAFIRKRKPTKETELTSDSSSSTSTSGEKIVKPYISLLRKPYFNVTVNKDTKEKTAHNADGKDEDVVKKNITLRFGGSCSKGASKACVTACKSVLKVVCREYRCSSRMKSRFKSECKKNCRTKFDVNSRTSS